jgi:hypothetical protein
MPPKSAATGRGRREERMNVKKRERENRRERGFIVHFLHVVSPEKCCQREGERE